MPRSVYIAGLWFLGACLLATIIAMTLVLLGIMGLESDRPTATRGLAEMLLVGVVFIAAWLAAYRLTNRTSINRKSGSE